MAITVTDKGTAAVGPAATIPGLTLAAGDTLVVACAIALDTVASALWGATSLTQIHSGYIDDVNYELWYLPDAAAGTHDLVVADLGGGIVITAASVSGLTAAPLDQIATASGVNADPIAGPTSTTSQDDELWFGAFSLSDQNYAYSWLNDFTSLHDAIDGASCRVKTGYRLVSTTGAAEAHLAGAPTNMVWFGGIATFKVAGTEAPWRYAGGYSMAEYSSLRQSQEVYSPWAPEPIPRKRKKRG